MIIDAHAHITAPDSLYVWKSGLVSHRGAHGKYNPDPRVSDDKMIAALNKPTFGASSHIEQIKEVQPQGPYNLVGYCFGSLVAFEIAARLQREGHEVAILASINGPSTSYIHHFDPENNRRDDEDESPLAAPAVAAHASRVPKLINGIVRIVRRYKPKALLHLAIRVGKPLPEQLRENNIFQQLSIKAQNSYKQPRFEGTMLVYRAVDLYEQEDLGFRDFVDGDVLCVEVPGYQPVARWTMKEPTVGCIADHLFAQITGARNIVEIEKSSIETRSESLR